MIDEVLTERETTHGDFYEGAIDFRELMNVIGSRRSNLDTPNTTHSQ